MCKVYNTEPVGLALQDRCRLMIRSQVSQVVSSQDFCPNSDTADMNSGQEPTQARYVIPAKAGIHPIIYHSREGGNPHSNTPSFPRRRESTIPAHAGIHRPITPIPEKILRHSCEGGNPHPIIRHSREGGNPQFPRMRELIVPLPQCPKKYSVIPTKAGIHTPSSVIPAKAGIHNSRACGN